MTYLELYTLLADQHTYLTSCETDEPDDERLNLLARYIVVEQTSTLPQD